MFSEMKKIQRDNYQTNSFGISALYLNTVKMLCTHFVFLIFGISKLKCICYHGVFKNDSFQVVNYLNVFAYGDVTVEHPEAPFREFKWKSMYKFELQISVSSGRIIQHPWLSKFRQRQRGIYFTYLCRIPSSIVLWI